jgi:flagellar biosynthesis protein FlhF
MKIKRFVAPDMRQAMREVREEQGPDAVILSTRRIDDGIEIIAALGPAGPTPLSLGR